ncbi:MAG: DUF5662 family protein [Phycisphaerales bacterium JB064]
MSKMLTDKDITAEEAIFGMRETLAHKLRVAELLADVAGRLVQRAIHHDDSKFDEVEFPTFAAITPRLKGVTYGSDEYKATLAEFRPAIERHQKTNTHHPEFFGERGIAGMSLLDLMEMLCDWKAATERHDDGDLRRSIEINAQRFGYGEEISNLLTVTAVRLRLIPPEAEASPEAKP